MTIPVFRARTCPWVMITAMLFCVVTEARGDVIKVLVYGSALSVNDQAAAITNASGSGTTFQVTATSSTGSITTANLANFDVFYAGSEFGHNLDPFSAVLQDYLAMRGGIVVGQPNVAGSISWLPSSLSVNVASGFYHSTGGTNSLTAAGAVSPIFTGLTAAALGGPPFDAIDSAGLGAGWTVLANNTEGGDVDVAMASGSFGNHRVLLWPGRFDSNLFANPSSTLIRQAFSWTATAAVPEPSSLVSAAVGLAALAGHAGWRRARSIRP